MRIDLPGCDFTNCKYYLDGNCTKKEKYNECPYAINQQFTRTELSKHISCINPHSSEALVITFNTEKISIHNANRYISALSMLYPEYPIMALPDFISLHSMSKDVLENYISMIQEVIDKLQEDR